MSFILELDSVVTSQVLTSFKEISYHHSKSTTKVFCETFPFEVGNVGSEIKLAF